MDPMKRALLFVAFVCLVSVGCQLHSRIGERGEGREALLDGALEHRGRQPVDDDQDERLAGLSGQAVCGAQRARVRSPA